MEIKKRNRTELKSFFVKNAIPTEGEFAELIEGMVNQKDDGFAKLPGSPLSIEASGDDASQKKAINFYKNFSDANPNWVFSLNPRSDPSKPQTAKPGFSLSDNAGNSRLFIDESTGKVGIGTVTPIQNLDVNGRMHLNNGVIQRGGAAITKTSDLGLYSQVSGSWIRIVSNAGPIRFFTDSGRGTAIKLSIEANGDISIPGTLSFGSSVRQMLNLYGMTYGFGVQSSTQYFRTGANFAWYKGGSHNNSALNAGTGGTVQMVIKNGSVGIGTAAPTHQFHVRANNAVGLFESSGTQAYLRLSTSEGMGKRVEIANRPGGRLALWVTTAGDVFNITTAGNVGIGTTGPTAKLEVNGDIKTNVGLISDNPHGANYVAFSHKNQGTAGGYALLQHKDGNTYLNAPTGKLIQFRINNVTKMSLNANGTVSINSLASLNVANSFSATIACADFKIGHSGRRGSPGRAFVDGKTVLNINYGNDWTSGCRYYGSMSKASSKKFKEAIIDLSSKEACDAVKVLQPVKFKLKKGNRKDIHVGFIAEDVPSLVATEDRAAVNNDHILALLTRVVKDQQLSISLLQNEVSVLKKGHLLS